LNTLLPDRTVIQSYKETCDGRERAVHILNRPDLSCVIIDAQDKTRIISSNARVQLNEANGRAAIGKDYDYLSELAQPESEGPLLYYVNIAQKCEETRVWVHDHDMATRYNLTGQLELFKDILFVRQPKSPSVKAIDKSAVQDDSFVSAPDKAKKGKGKVVEEPPKEPEVPPEIEEIGGY